MRKLLLIFCSLLMFGACSVYPMQQAEGATKLFAVGAFLDMLQAAAEETGHVLALDCGEAPTEASLYRRLQQALEECPWKWIFSWDTNSAALSCEESPDGRFKLELFYENLLINAGIFLTQKEEAGIEHALGAQTRFWKLLLSAGSVKLCRDLYRNSSQSHGLALRQVLLTTWQGDDFIRIEKWRGDVDTEHRKDSWVLISPLLMRQERNRTPLSDASFGDSSDCEGEQE